MSNDIIGEFTNSESMKSYRYLDGVDILIIDFKDKTRKSFTVSESVFKKFIESENKDAFYNSNIEDKRRKAYTCGSSELADGTYTSFVREEGTKENVYYKEGFRNQDLALSNALKESKKWHSSRS